MFTGIVEEAGRVRQVNESASGIRLTVETNLAGAGTALGDSIAVNGCCLTVVDIHENGRLLGFDLLRETWQRTNLSAVQRDSLVNLERSMRSDGRIHGHFVTGHIDGTGQIEIFEKRGADWYLRIQASPDILKYMVFKGAIAVDGISLTIAELRDQYFALWIIPHTYSVTALRDRKPGALVNLEADLLAKYVEKLVAK
jgi:riboflavin synthase